MDKQPATVKFEFPDLEPTLADLKQKVLALLNSEELAKKFATEFPKNATARGPGFVLKTFTIGGTLTGTDAGGKGGVAGGGTFTFTFGPK